MGGGIVGIEWMYHFAQLYMELLKIIVWPLTVVFIVFLLKNRIASIFLKHNGTEVELKTLDRLHKNLNKDLESVGAKMPEVAQKLQKQVDDIYHQAKVFFSESAKKVERDSNSFGCYALYNNGLVIQEFTIQPGALEEQGFYTLPAHISEVISVVFVGEEKPTIIDIKGTYIKLGIKGTNKSAIKVIVGGVK